MHAIPDGFELNRYQVLGVLGAGGFGITYRALDHSTNEIVAIKEYFLRNCCIRGKDGAVQPAAIYEDDYDWAHIRFHREVQRLSKIEHEFIVRVRDGFSDNNTSYMVMDYVEGEKLSRLVRYVKHHEQVINESALLNIFNPLLSALEAIHEKFIVHRDIKPDNIFIRRDGRPVLLDFGSAREIRQSVATEITRIVTDGYAPPEQYKAWSKEQGPWSDIYSLGITFWQLVTGRTPEKGDDRKTKITGGKEDRMGNILEEFAHHYSGRLLDTIYQSISVHTGERPQSAMEAGRMLPAPKEPDRRLVDPLRFDEVLEAFQSEPEQTHVPTKVATLRDRAVLVDHEAAGKTFQNSLKNGSNGPLMAIIPTGFFHMGSPDDETGRRSNEGPLHWVEIGAMIAVGKYPVTFAEYDRFAAGTKRPLPQDRGWGRENRPVINVSWDDAIAYTEWLSAETGRVYRLLTEAEWEYVARADSTTPYWWGTEADGKYANYDCSDSEWNGERSSPVDSYPANAFGIYDTAGNVWEWVQDFWHDTYDDAPRDGSAWESPKATHQITRGGSRFSNPEDIRSARREGMRADARSANVGFRVARET